MIMAKDKKSLLFVTNDEELKVKVIADLESTDNRVVTASNDNEARLKVGGEDFQFVIVDMNMKGFNPLGFVESIRRKEKLRCITNLLPVIILGDCAADFQKDYLEFEVVTFLEKPLDYEELKTKLAVLGGSSVISENTRPITKDTVLIEEGTTSKEMYWVLNGSFITTKKSDVEGQDQIIGEIGAGELIGEMSFLDSKSRSASVTALEDSEVLVIPHRKFVHTMDKLPRWLQTLMKTLSLRLRNSNELITHPKEKK
jgi:CheY-like chemotaxis protein